MSQLKSINSYFFARHPIADDLSSYLEFYGCGRFLPFVADCSLVASGPYQIACYTLKKPHTDPVRGRFVVCHGYFDHALNMLGVAIHLAELGFEVILYDLPGHGLSSGDRYSIHSFADYEQALQSVFECFFADSMPAYFLGHSTGCVGAFINAQKTKPIGFLKMFMWCPLIRLPHWWALMHGCRHADSLVARIPRRITRSEPHAELEVSIRPQHDPLQHQFVSSQWLRQLYLWNRAQERLPDWKHEAELYFVQGDQDKVVDWAYSQKIYKKHFPQFIDQPLIGAGHHIMSDLAALEQALLFLSEALDLA